MGSSKKKTATQGVPRRDINAAERAAMAIDLMKQRLTYDQIAQRCGYSDRSAARKAIQREMQRRIVPKIDEYRAQELDILDEIHRRVWEVAFSNENDDRDNIKEKDESREKNDKNEDKVNLWAVDRLLELSRDRRKLLNVDVQPEDTIGAQVIIREIPANYLEGPKVNLEGVNGA